MWQRLMGSVERSAEVRLQVFRVPPVQGTRPQPLSIRWSGESETLPRRMWRSIRRLRREVGRATRGGLARYLRVRSSERSRVK
jgi:hypothetical protein